MPTRWNDVSGDGCISHVSLARYMEDARVVLLKQVMSHSPVKQHGLRVFVARLYLEQSGDVFYPQELVMGAGISRLGTSSYTIAIGVFLDGDCIGMSETVNVSVDDNGKPTPIPEEHRNYLLAESMGQDLQLAARGKPGEECFQMSRYPHVCTFDTRFSDTDRLGHINNVAIVRYYDDALAQLLSGCYDPAESLKPGWHGKTVRADVSSRAEASPGVSINVRLSSRALGHCTSSRAIVSMG